MILLLEYTKHDRSHLYTKRQNSRFVCLLVIIRIYHCDSGGDNKIKTDDYADDDNNNSDDNDSRGVSRYADDYN